MPPSRNNKRTPTLEDARVKFRGAPRSVVIRAALQMAVNPSRLLRWVEGTAELDGIQSEFLMSWFRKGDHPVWLSPDDYAQLRVRFKGAAHGSQRYAAREIGIAEDLLCVLRRRSVNPAWSAVHAIKRWLTSTDENVLRPVSRSVMASIRRVFKNAPADFRRATARAIGVGEPELSRWVSGAAQPGIASVRLIKEWWSRGGFDSMEKTPPSHSADTSKAVIERLRDLLADAPQGALRVAAAGIGCDANSLGTYVSGARKATPETLRKIDAWLATVDVKSYQGFTPLEWRLFRSKYGKLNRPEKRRFAQELGVSENSLDGWYWGSAQPKLLAVRRIRAWLQNGSRPPAPRRKRPAVK